MNIDKQYKNLLSTILKDGYEYVDTKRDVKCKQIDTHTLDIDLTKGFPAITLKKLYWKGVVGELLWFLRGDTNIKYLVDNNINIWNKDAYNWYKFLMQLEGNKENKIINFDRFIDQIAKNRKFNENFKPNNYKWGDLGRVYGAQWRKWTNMEVTHHEETYPDFYENFPIDQISNLIKNLKEQPMSRRHIVTAWNPAELNDMALPPCHWSFEIIVRPIGIWECDDPDNPYWLKKLDKDGNPYGCLCCGDGGVGPCGDIKYGFTLKWHQRSVDTYLGLPFNIASYALLAHIIGKLTNMKPLRLIGDLSNVHLYENSWDAAKQLLDREGYDSPQLDAFKGFKTIMINNLEKLLEEYKTSDFKLKNYKSHDNIPVEMLAPKNNGK